MMRPLHLERGLTGKMAFAMNAATIRSDWVGSVVDGRFTLLQWLGGSDSSDVFLTELQEHQPRKAAIKLIPADSGNVEARLAGWTAAKALSHPHLMLLFRTGRCQIGDAGLLYVVTEYAEEVLSEVLPERALTPLMAREMLDPVIDVLSYLHGKGYVHGRLKPSNIMVVDNQLKLSCDSIQSAGRLRNRVQPLSIYDAPEGGRRAIAPAADIWSLGVTLVEALTQHPPVWDRSADSEPVVPESIPQPFAAIAQECLRRELARRCTLSDVKARLGPDLSRSEKAGKTGEKIPAKLRSAVLVAAVLVLIAVTAVMLARSHKTRPSSSTVEQRPAPAIATPTPQSPASAQSLPAVPVSSPAHAPASAPEIQTSKGAVVKGAVDERVLPEVMPSASESIQGQVSVAVRVMVDPGGNVSNATFDSPGPSKYFAKVALQAAQHWRFKPAQMDGQAVSSVWILHFHFTRSGIEVAPVEASP
jgi:TonB family protein